MRARGAWSGSLLIVSHVKVENARRVAEWLGVPSAGAGSPGIVGAGHGSEDDAGAAVVALVVEAVVEGPVVAATARVGGVEVVLVPVEHGDVGVGVDGFPTHPEAGEAADGFGVLPPFGAPVSLGPWRRTIIGASHSLPQAFRSGYRGWGAGGGGCRASTSSASSGDTQQGVGFS